MPKDTKTLGNNKARAWESLGFAHKKRLCQRFDTTSDCRFRNLIRVWVTQILEYKHLLLGRKPAVIVRKIAGFCQQCCQFCTSFDAALQTSHCIFGSSATGEIHLRQFRKGRSRFCHLLSFRLMLSIVRYANIRNQDTPCQVFRALIMKFLLESFPLYISLVVCGGIFWWLLRWNLREQN